MQQIIGLVGLKQVGKSTVASHLEEKHGFVRHNFKDALVEEIKQNFPDLLKLLSELYELTIDELFEVKPPLMRALMQNYGTEVRRGDDPQYWIKRWEEKLGDSNTVVDDVRFKNEADAVKSKYGTVVRLTRPDIIPGDGHDSETEGLSIEDDYEIHSNKGSHDSLYEMVDDVLNDIE